MDILTESEKPEIRQVIRQINEIFESGLQNTKNIRCPRCGTVISYWKDIDGDEQCYADCPADSCSFSF